MNSLHGDKNLIVTRHTGLVVWLHNHGIDGVVIEQARPSDVVGQDVIGVLPLHLAALAKSVTVVNMPGLSADQRGKDLSPAEMDAAGAYLSRYVVTES